MDALIAHARASGSGAALLRAAVLAAVVLFIGCGNASPGTVSLGAATTTPRSTSSRVIVVLLENAEYSEVIGNSSAPYANALARSYGLMTQSFAIRHPSLPNYLALTSGSTHGIDSDCTGCSVSGANIVDQLEGAGRSWGAYLEDLPASTSGCFAGAQSGGYAKKHNPFAYYTDIARSPARCRHVQGFAQLASGLRAGRLPEYVWISPNLCDDGHDCGERSADQFLTRSVPALLRALGPRGFLVVQWDEGTSDRACCGVAAGGQIATIVAGPQVRSGARSAAPIDQYGVLGSIEEAFGLAPLGGAADPRSGRLTALFQSPPRLR